MNTFLYFLPCLALTSAIIAKEVDGKLQNVHGDKHIVGFFHDSLLFCDVTLFVPSCSRFTKVEDI